MTQKIEIEGKSYTTQEIVDLITPALTLIENAVAKVFDVLLTTRGQAWVALVRDILAEDEEGFSQLTRKDAINDSYRGIDYRICRYDDGSCYVLALGLPGYAYIKRWHHAQMRDVDTVIRNRIDLYLDLPYDGTMIEDYEYEVVESRSRDSATHYAFCVEYDSTLEYGASKADALIRTKRALYDRLIEEKSSGKCIVFPNSYDTIPF